MADPILSEGPRDPDPPVLLIKGTESLQPTWSATSHIITLGEEQALESHEVFELQTFSERKAWIEEKIKFLASLPPIEVFTGLEDIRSSSDDVEGLPTREELQRWMVEHDTIEKETEIFDTGELTKLRQLTKAATQRNLSPRDTDVIELTLTTIYALDKLLRLLRDRSENLEMMSIRLTWEENRQNAWKERRQIVQDLNAFSVSRARWSSKIYETIAKSEDLHNISRRGSIASQASAASDTPINTPAFSRSARFNLAEILSREAAQFSAMIASLKHGKVTAAGKALDRLIDHSRKPVPEELLDEQDRLEDKCINEMENIGKFTMNLVMQWRKADEIYVETMRDHATASNLLEEIETAKLHHPTARQSTSFISRTDTILKRLAVRGDPASPVSVFPRPEHFLFPDQKASNGLLVKELSAEIDNANRLARKVELAAKDYRAAYEAVRQVETLVQSIGQTSATLASIYKNFEEGISGTEGDGSPPDLNSEHCLDPAAHSVFLALLPSLLENTVSSVDSVDILIQGAPSSLLGLDIQGIDLEFKENAVVAVKKLSSLRKEVLNIRDSVLKRVTRLRESRKMSSEIDSRLASLKSLKTQMSACMMRDRWQQEFNGGTPAPPAPDSPSVTYQAPNIAFENQLLQISSRMKQDIYDPLQQLYATLESPLQVYLEDKVSNLTGSLEDGFQLLRLLSMIRKQSLAMNSIRNDFHDILSHLEDSKIHTTSAIHDIFQPIADDTGQNTSVNTVDLQALEQKVTDFIDSLPSRVPFVATSLTDGTTSTKARFNPLANSLELDRVDGLQFDPMTVDAAVRMDSNHFAMCLSGNLESLKKEKRHLELAVMAKCVDSALTCANNEIDDIDCELLAQKTFFENIPRLAEEAVTQLQGLFDGLLAFATKRSQISHTFSPTQKLICEMDEISTNLEPSIRNKLYRSRSSRAVDTELRISNWDKALETFKDEVGLTLRGVRAYQAEVRAAEARKRRVEEERIVAEEAERVRLEKERVENEEKQRMLEEKLAEEHRQQLEHERLLLKLAEEERLEQKAAEAERMRLEVIIRQEEAARMEAERDRIAREESERVRLQQERSEMVERLRATEAQLQEERRLHSESELATMELAEKQRLKMEEFANQQQVEIQRLQTDEIAKQQAVEMKRLQMEEFAKQQQAAIQRLVEDKAHQEEIQHITRESKVNGVKTIRLPRTNQNHTPTEEFMAFPNVEPDVFGSQATSKSLGSQESIDLQSEILTLRKRLCSIGIKDYLHPSRSPSGLPTEEQYKKWHVDISAVSQGLKRLPSATKNAHVNAELSALKTDVEEMFTLLAEVYKLVGVYHAVKSCDAALSDLLEHIDSYPAIPSSVLSAHRSVATVTPEEQLSARLNFTKNIVDDLSSRLTACIDDHRAVSEHTRIQQTWTELQEMADDRLRGNKSRPTSVISTNSSRSHFNSGTAIRPSVLPPVPTHSRGPRKRGSYSHLSVSSILMPSQDKMLVPPQQKPRRAISGSIEAPVRSTSRLSSVSSNRSVSGPFNSSLYGSTFASRQRTASLSNAPAIPVVRPSIPPASRASLSSMTKRSNSPAISENPVHSRSSLAPSRSTANTSTWSRAPRDSILPQVPILHKKADVLARKKYVANPKSKLDVAVGDVINQLPVGINIEGITESWRDQSGKYWIGNQDPKLCFCRILRSQTVMVRVGGGWTELSRFIKDHFAESFVINQESTPRLGSQAEKWISSATLSETWEPETPPRTPEPTLPSFSILTPSGRTPQSIQSSPSNRGSPLTPLQFIRRADLELSPGRLRPVTPSKAPLRNSNPIVNATRGSVWRP